LGRTLSLTGSYGIEQAPEWAVEYPVIVSGHANGAMRFWRLLPKKLAKAAPTEGGVLGDGSQNREEKLALELIFVCTRTHEAAVTAVSFSADGQQMFTGDSRGTVIMWGKDRKSGACLTTFLALSLPSLCLPLALTLPVSSLLSISLLMSMNLSRLLSLLLSLSLARAHLRATAQATRIRQSGLPRR
jgi:WD40 repeat protein